MNQVKGQLFDLQRREGGLKDIHCGAQNAALLVGLRRLLV